MRKMIFVTVLLLILVCLIPAGAVQAAGDTGTYRILEYHVVLTPTATGEVEISYTQKWQVTGGHIPWVTVGLPNADYTVKDFGGAAKSVKPANEGGWYGVRVDLDKDYQPQEIFQFNFKVLQRRLLERKDDGFRINYTPGWYDRCFTDLLTIKLVSLAKVEDLKFNPQPTNVAGQEILWEKKNLGKGERFNISVSFAASAFPDIPTKDTTSKGGFPWWGWLLIAFGGVGLIIFFVWMVNSGDSGSESSYSSSGSTARKRTDDDDRSYRSPVILVGSSRGSSGSSSSRSSSSSGGGGGFGGRSSSCACACVSCACACACAGGGGAGCSRKMYHSCPVCVKSGEDKNEKKQT